MPGLPVPVQCWLHRAGAAWGALQSAARQAFKSALTKAICQEWLRQSQSCPGAGVYCTTSACPFWPYFIWRYD